MQTETFDWLWQQMKTDIEAIENEMLTYNTTDTTANPFSFKLTYGSSTKQTIYEAYLKIKTDLKKRCYASEINEEKEFNLVDQHKIAACFCKAFIDKKVFTFELKENTPPDMILSNYTLAYTISLRLIFLYLMDYYSDYQTNLDLQLKTKCLNKLQKNQTLLVPETTPSHDKYHLGRIKTLALNDYYGIPLDLLTYADMMFWIEHFNKLILEEKL